MEEVNVTINFSETTFSHTLNDLRKTLDTVEYRVSLLERYRKSDIEDFHDLVRSELADYFKDIAKYLEK